MVSQAWVVIIGIVGTLFGLVTGAGFIYLKSLKQQKLLDLDWSNRISALEQEKLPLIEKLAKAEMALQASQQNLQQQNQNFEQQLSRELSGKENIIRDLRESLNKQTIEKDQLMRELIVEKEKEPQRLREHGQSIEKLTHTISRLESERQNERLSAQQAEEKRRQDLEAQWLKHEKNVEEEMQLLCQKFSIEYINKEKFPFAGGKPDNCVKIGEEYVIFDSKSPEGADLSHFPKYIKAQAEAVKKYTKHEGVKKDVYLVIPTSALSVVSEKFYQLADVRVHVISTDGLGPVLLHLKKIEDYEFAEQLSPEDREKIVTVLGKMAHAMKRRVQIDYFMANEFISILSDADNLPEEVLEEARKVEKTIVLNPTMQKRAKNIDLKSLEKEKEKVTGKVIGQEIYVGKELEEISQLPLHARKE